MILAIITSSVFNNYIANVILYLSLFFNEHFSFVGSWWDDVKFIPLTTFCGSPK